MASDAPWRHLHWATVPVNLVPRMWSTARLAWPLVLAWVLGRASGRAAFDLALFGLFLAPSVFGTVVHFATLRYRLVGEHLEIESGLLLRTRRSIGRDRVQNVEVVRNVFHRLAGLAEVRVETASGREVEGLLSALSVPDAEALVEALRRPVQAPAPADGAAPTPPAATPPADVLAALGWMDVAWAGVTALRPASVAVGAVVVWNLVLGSLDPTTGAGQMARGDLPSVALGLLVASGAFLAAIGTTVLRHAGFRLTARGSHLSVEEGLLTRRRSELRTDRIQLVVFEQGLARRLLGAGALSLETAAGRAEGDGTERASTKVPWVDVDAVGPLIDRVVGGDPAAIELLPPHPSAGLRAAVPRALVLGVVAAALTAYGTVFAWVAWGALVAGVASAWIAASAERWAVTEGFVVARTGWAGRRTALIPRARIQSVRTVTTPWLERAGLSRLVVRIAGHSIQLPLMRAEEAGHLLDRLSRGAR